MDYYGCRLPTEAEWEYACRAGTTGQTYGILDYVAWHSGMLVEIGSHPVAEKEPNPWGFNDMLGNLYEWCADAYDEQFYSMTARDDPFVADGDSRVLRGGSWNDPPASLRAAARYANLPRVRHSHYGFRCARAAP